ncbi:MAG TPA: hypothetical protein VEG34_03470, partial [Thermoanaerobaculia bacterium]|nr:hypothetical protein [Thermoanaerobaculia bacterium]
MPGSALRGLLLAALALAAAPAAAADGVAVGGRVLGPAGGGLAGVAVELLAEIRPTAERAAASPVARMVTGPDGAFRLLAPEPGLW